jgi:Family of unknown function (DUF5677)
MSDGQLVYPSIEIEFLELLKQLQPVFAEALNSLGGKKPSDTGSAYLGTVAITVNQAADGYLWLRESKRMDASKLLIRPALEAVFCGIAAVKNKEFLFRKAYSEWKEDKKLFAKDVAANREADKYLEGLKRGFKEHSPDYPVKCEVLLIQQIAEMAGLSQVYEGAYRVYCQFTHSAMRAVSGNLNQVTDVKDSQTIVWCVLIMLGHLKQFTPAEIPDLMVFKQKVEFLTKQLSNYTSSTRISIS